MLGAPPSGPTVTPWERGPDLPLARAGAAVAWIGDRLVVAGGSYWEAGEKKWTARTDAFEPVSQRWTELPELPEPVSNAASAGDGESLYVLGGMLENKATARCRRLRRAGEEWRWDDLPDLPHPTAYGGGVWLDGRLYCAGGAANPTDLKTVSGEAFRLDLRRAGARWEPAAPIPGSPRAIAASAADGRYLYLFGGCRGIDGGKVENLAEVLRYDPRDNRWRPRRPLPTPLRASAAVALPKSRIAVLGGYSGGPDDAERYGPAYGFERRSLIYETDGDRFRDAAALPDNLADGDAAFRGDRIYVVSGEDRARSRIPLLASVPVDDLVANRTSRPIWVCLGDSVTHGVGRSGVSESGTYPRALETSLSGREGAPWVTNAGLGGETTQAAVRRLPSVAKPLPRVDLVVLMYGLNDAALIDAGPAERTEPRVPLAEYRENLRALLAEARRLGARPVLCTPNPMTRAYAYANRGAYARGADINFVLRDYAEAVRKLAREEKTPLADVYRRFERTRNWEKLLPDGIHPNAEGLAMIADEVRRAVIPEPRPRNG